MDRFLEILQDYWQAYLFWDGFEISQALPLPYGF
ncbi:hypothetical protein OURE66S_03882 [Oligella ureolytica]